jgi:creatinine amidohydrolase
VRLVDQAWPEVREGALILVPVGSCEQHGPHLPLDSDTCIAERVAGHAARALSDGEPVVYFTPAVTFGASGEHADFAGTLSVGNEALTLFLCELARSAWWCSRIVFVNGHGGNVPSLIAAVQLQRNEGRDVAWFACASEGADAHAGRAETSMLLALAPGRVRTGGGGSGVTTPIADLMPRLVAEGVRSVSPSGVLGDPAGASTSEGHERLESMSRSLVEAIHEWRLRDDGSFWKPRSHAD